MHGSVFLSILVFLAIAALRRAVPQHGKYRSEMVTMIARRMISLAL